MRKGNCTVFRASEHEHGHVGSEQSGCFYIPPMTPHLSIADKGTVMIEHIVYLGSTDDWQESLPA